MTHYQSLLIHVLTTGRFFLLIMPPSMEAAFGNLMQQWQQNQLFLVYETDSANAVLAAFIIFSRKYLLLNCEGQWKGLSKKQRSKLSKKKCVHQLVLPAIHFPCSEATKSSQTTAITIFQESKIRALHTMPMPLQLIQSNPLALESHKCEWCVLITATILSISKPPHVSFLKRNLMYHDI